MSAGSGRINVGDTLVVSRVGAVQGVETGDCKGRPNGAEAQLPRSIRPARLPVGLPSCMNTSPLTSV